MCLKSIMRRDIFSIWYYGFSRVRALVFLILTGVRFKSVGKNLKLFGVRHMSIGKELMVGDNCWLQAVTVYKGARYSPNLVIGDAASLSDSVHISCVGSIIVGSGTLIGSNVYIGDHSHGPTLLEPDALAIPPALRPLEDVASIVIGKNVWIGDGAKILGGAVIADGSVVGANAVVKNKFTDPGLILGVPAVLKRRF